MMMRLSVFVLVVCLCFASTANAQEFPSPSEGHKILMRDVGNWAIEGKMMMPEGMQEFKGEEKVVAVGGFWTVSHYSSDALGGMKGSSTMGYDPNSKKYVGSWVDSVQPSATHMEGTYDEEAKTMTYATTGMGMDGQPVKGKIVIKHIDEDSHTFTMMMTDPTGESDEMMTVMEMTYTRKRDAKLLKPPK